MEVDALATELKDLAVSTPTPLLPERLLRLHHLIEPYGIGSISNINYFLLSHKAVIAGSLVVSAMLQSKWQPQDLDIFMPFREKGSSHSYFKSMGWEEVEVNSTSYEWLCSEGCHAHVSEMHLNGRKVNLIGFDACPEKDDVVRLIQHNFDLDGCAMCYDGIDIIHNPRISNYDFCAGHWTYNMYGLCRAMIKARISKSGSLVDFLARTQSRLEKYQARGILIVNGHEILQKVIQCTLVNINPRTLKYHALVAEAFKGTEFK